MYTSLHRQDRFRVFRDKLSSPPTSSFFELAVIFCQYEKLSQLLVCKLTPTQLEKIWYRMVEFYQLQDPQQFKKLHAANRIVWTAPQDILLEKECRINSELHYLVTLISQHPSLSQKLAQDLFNYPIFDGIQNHLLTTFSLDKAFLGKELIYNLEQFYAYEKNKNPHSVAKYNRFARRLQYLLQNPDFDCRWEAYFYKPEMKKFWPILLRKSGNELWLREVVDIFIEQKLSYLNKILENPQAPQDLKELVIRRRLRTDETD